MFSDILYIVLNANLSSTARIELQDEFCESLGSVSLDAHQNDDQDHLPHALDHKECTSPLQFKKTNNSEGLEMDKLCEKVDKLENLILKINNKVNQCSHHNCSSKNMQFSCTAP